MFAIVSVLMSCIGTACYANGYGRRLHAVADLLIPTMSFAVCYGARLFHVSSDVCQWIFCLQPRDTICGKRQYPSDFSSSYFSALTASQPEISLTCTDTTMGFLSVDCEQRPSKSLLWEKNVNVKIGWSVLAGFGARQCRQWKRQ